MSQITTDEFETFVLPLLVRPVDDVHKLSISLRDVEKFLTNCKKLCPELYASYVKQMKLFGKKMFDPFNRRKIEQHTFYGKDCYGNLETFYLSQAQVNFFRWAIDEDLNHNIMMTRNE